VTGGSSAIRRAIHSPVDAVTLVIETVVNAIAAIVQAIVDAIAATVEAVFNTITAIVDAIGDGIAVVGDYGVAQEQHSRDKQAGLGCIPYGPCIHVITPDIQTFYFSLFVQRTVSARVDTEHRPFPIIVKLAWLPAIWQAHHTPNKDRQWPWLSPPPPISTHSFAGSAFA